MCCEEDSAQGNTKCQEEQKQVGIIVKDQIDSKVVKFLLKDSSKV